MEKSDVVARVATHKNIEVLPTELPIQILSKILTRISEEKLREAEKRTIESMFRDATEDFCAFLFSVAQNLVCIQILNLDPECQSLEREAFRRKALFLDTNVLIALLCPTNWMHKVAEHLVTLTRLLGAKCVVTKRTYQEYLILLDEANNIYMKWQAPYRFLENADNEFLSSFWFEKKTTPSQSWRGYYYRMKQIEGVLKKLKIEYYTENVDKVLKNPHFETIRDEVDSCYKKVKRKRKRKEVCEHDAFHMLLMRELRKKDKLTFLGPNYWFATGDESLLCVDNKINTLSDYSDKTPSSMLCDLWLEMISPFLPINVREKDAYEAFSMLIKQQFAMIPFEIETDTLLEIQGSWMKYDWLEAKDIVRIQNEEWTRRYITKVREARKEGVPPSKMEELAKVFADKLEKELKIIRDEKLKQLSQKMQTLNEEQIKLYNAIQEQRQTIVVLQELVKSKEEELEQRQDTIKIQEKELEIETHFKRIMRVISAIAGLFLIGSPPAFIILRILPIDVTTVAYCAGSFIVGAILLYFAIAYEKAKVSLEAKLNLSKKAS